MSGQGQGGLDNYASPILRAAVFRRLYPGAQVSYKVIPIEEAFPAGHTEYEGQATEAVRCEIVLADGTYVVAHKEMDKLDVGKYKTSDRAQTPEELAKDETKALGRALRDLGIPQRLTELRLLMQWIASMSGAPVATSGGATPSVAAAAPADDDTFSGGDDDDSPDAGSEPSIEQQVAQRFSHLSGASKAAVSKYARESLGVSNVMRAGEHAAAMLDYIEQGAWMADHGGQRPDDEEPF